MNSSKTYDLIIIGGGLAGLTAALHLSKSNLEILLIEKYPYPHHKVCGEYVSNEVLNYLAQLGIYPAASGAIQISNFEISTKNGNKVSAKLPLGGFGISRYAFDHMFYKALKDRIEVIFETVEGIYFSSEIFSVSTNGNHNYQASYVLGAFGKRSQLDSFLKRGFMKQKSPWLGVKAHYDFPFNRCTVALHNFEGGYCGLSQVESGAVNACYLTTYASFKKFGSIDTFQKQLMSKNPHLKRFFSNAKPLWEKPLTISQVSFEKKSPVEKHIFMIGDSAGLIHPLCGNGMAMAIHSAKLFSELFLKSLTSEQCNRKALEQEYIQQWQNAFQARLVVGRRVQNLLINPATANMGLKIAQWFPGIVPKIIRKTHGDMLT